MDFGFSEEQREVQTLARQILSEEVTAERLAAFDEFQQEGFDTELWQKLVDAGLLGVAIEEAYGGMGFGFTELALLIEELGRTIAPVPVISHLVSAALPIQRFGSEAQKQRLLPGVVDGSGLLTAALSTAYPLPKLPSVLCCRQPRNRDRSCCCWIPPVKV
jgi:alkylation response protein AidB-like acyl-CoA dehydrogenase